MSRVAAALLAEQISGKLTEACLAWGRAINEAEAVKDKPEDYERRSSLARMYGAEVANLSAAIAKVLRP